MCRIAFSFLEHFLSSVCCDSKCLHVLCFFLFFFSIVGKLLYNVLVSAVCSWVSHKCTYTPPSWASHPSRASQHWAELLCHIAAFRSYFTHGGVYIVSATLPVHPTLPFLLLHVSLCPTLIEETIIFLLRYSITFINQVVM